MSCSSDFVFKLTVLLSVLSSAFLYFATGGYSGSMATIMAEHGSYAQITNDTINSTLAALWLVLPMLMLTYKKLFRTIFLAYTFVYVAMLPFLGIGVFTGLEMAVLYCSIWVDGVIITLAFTSERYRFEKSK